MDSPLYAMLFAEDLISSFLETFKMAPKYTYSVIPHRDKLKTRLTPQITEAVRLLVAHQWKQIDSCYEKLVQQNIKSKDDFRLEVSITTVYNFPSGYDPDKFLNMCALLVGLSLRYATEDNFKIADASAQVLAYILNFFIYMLEFDPRYSWFELSYAAQKVRRKFV